MRSLTLFEFTREVLAHLTDGPPTHAGILAQELVELAPGLVAVCDLDWQYWFYFDTVRWTVAEGNTVEPVGEHCARVSAGEVFAQLLHLTPEDCTTMVSLSSDPRWNDRPVNVPLQD